MPAFANPFVGNMPDHLMNPDEAIRAVRLDIAAEEEAVTLYTAQAEALDVERYPELLFLRNDLIDISNEERVHIGELTKDLMELAGEGEYLEKGFAEVREKWGPMLRRIERVPV